MSILTYNNITLPYSNVTRFSQDVVYDEQGNTDWYCTKFDIQVTCFINLEYLEMIARQFDSVIALNSAAEIMSAIRTTLLKPRKLLRFICNGVNLIPARQGESNDDYNDNVSTGLGTVDAKNGPIPQSCSIDPITDHTYMLQFHIIAHYWENNVSVISPSGIVTTNTNGGVVLYNRWTETVEIDNCMYTKRTRDGKYVIRSDNIDGKVADEVRPQMAVLAVPTGFLRESAKYTISPDGLGIQYTIVDREVYKLPPHPAYEAEGEYTGSTAHGGGHVYGEVRLRLKGCKDPALSSQNDLLRVAVVLCATKLAIVGYGPAVIGNVKVRVDMFNNMVEVQMGAKMNPTKQQLSKVAGIIGNRGFLNNITQTPIVDAPGFKLGPRYTNRGTAKLLLQAAKYYDPNLENVQLGPGKLTAADGPNGDEITVLGTQLNIPKPVPGEAGKTPEV